MRTKTCVITSTGKRVCGTRTSKPSGSARRASGSAATAWAVEHAMESISDEEDRLEDEFVNFGLTVYTSSDANSATLHVEKGNYRATVRYSLGFDPAWKLVVDEQYSGPNYSKKCHYDERFDSSKKAFAEMRRQIGL